MKIVVSHFNSQYMLLPTTFATFSFHFFSRYFIMNFSDSEESDDELIVKSAPSKPVQTQPVVSGLKHLHDIKDMLDLDSYQTKLEKKRKKRKAAKARKAGKSLLAAGAVSTEASRSLGLTSPPEIVTFVDHKKRSKSSQNRGVEQSVLSESQNNRKPSKEISMKQARFEVFKFGVSGLDKKSQEEANTALAVRLGAKPAKSKGVEYKQLKEDRVKEKEEKLIKEEEHRNSLQGVKKSSKNGMTAKKSANKTKKKGKKGEFKVGAFDGGMLKLSQKDISSIKSKKKS